jgi:hypothetical protein
VDSVSGTQASATISAPALPGVGASAALDSVPRQKTWFVQALDSSSDVLAVVEVSHDDARFVPLFKIQGALFTKGDTVVTDGFYKSGRIRVISGTGTGLLVTALADPTCC